MMQRLAPVSLALLIAAVLMGCKPPPPAPGGLQDSLTYLFRNFYEEDEVVEVGLQSFLDWYAEDGDELLGQQADMENVGEFTLETLTEAEVAILPIEDEVILEYAPGTVALSELACPWAQVEGFLVRTDQDEVFGEFDTYERTFVTPRADYEGATDALEFSPVEEPLATPYDDPASIGDLTRTFLFTDNQTSTTELTVHMEFELLLTLRHGLFRLDDEDIPVFLILTWMPERAVSDGGDNSIEQSYSLELDIQRPGGKTLRLMASWLQMEGLFDHDSDTVKVVGVNKNLKASERLADICEGDVVLDPE